MTDVKEAKKNNTLIHLFIDHKKLFLLFGIIVLAITLRFYNYDNRWGLAADQARDVLVAKEALRLHILPLIGPFSASGPYVFGPYWYWLLMIPIGLFPQILLAPWLFLTTLYVVSVFIIFLTGKKLVNTNFGLLLALLLAVSPAEVQLSTNLIMSTFVCFLSEVIFYFFVMTLKDKKIRNLFFLSLLVGVAINSHFEAVPLVLLIPLAIIALKPQNKHIVLSSVFFLIPFTPLAIFNYLNHSYESTHIFLTNAPAVHESLLYIVLDLIKHELSFALVKIPHIWERTIVNVNMLIAGYVFCILFLTVLLWECKKKRIQKEFAFLFIGGGIITIFLGSYKGVIFDNFLSFTRPFILVFTVWLFFHLKQVFKPFGYVFLSLILFVGLFSDINIIHSATNTDIKTARYLEKKIVQAYPTQKISLYNYLSSNKDKSLALSLLLDNDAKINDQGIKIGFSYFGASVTEPILFDTPSSLGLRIYKLEKASTKEIQKEGFASNNPYAVYTSVERWYK